jgi:hypothetical protein
MTVTKRRAGSGLRIKTSAACLVLAATILMVPQAAAAASFSATCNGGACSGDWYRSGVTVVLNYAPDPGKQVASAPGCGSFYVNADTQGTSFVCTINYVGGGGAFSPTVFIRKDSTPPTVTAAAARGPDANGWYNHPVHIAFSGTDETSGVNACSSVDYSGPDNPNASVSGSCTDYAGNAASVAFHFKYDATPPKLSNLMATTNDKFVSLTWKASSDTASVQVTRVPGTSGADPSVVYSGQASRFDDRNVENHVKYQYTVTAVDQAANATSQSLTAIPAPALYAPAAGATVHGTPTLAWVRYRGATYYNVQLFRGGRKILSAWPRGTKFRLIGSWSFNGRRYKLTKGAYEWRVWPGVGKRRAHKYGPLLGHSTFILR